MLLDAEALYYLHKNYVAWLKYKQWEPELSMPKGAYPIQGERMLLVWEMEHAPSNQDRQEAETIVEARFNQTGDIWVVCRAQQVTALVMANSLSTADQQAGLWIGATDATEALQQLGVGSVTCHMGSVCRSYAELPHTNMCELSAWWTALSMLSPQERREHRKRIQNYLKKQQYGHIAGYITRQIKRDEIPPQAYWHWLPLIIESLWVQSEPSLSFITKNLSLEALRAGGVQQLSLWVRRICMMLKAANVPGDPIARVMNSIQRDCSLPYSQTNLAEGLGLTPTYFSRLFEKRAGIRFSAYLTNARMTHAQTMLKCGASLAEVVQACGYQRKSYFCEVFKKHTGMTALAYRAMPRKDDGS